MHDISTPPPPPRSPAQELERAKRIEKEKEEGGPDPRVIEMENLRAQIAPGGKMTGYDARQPVLPPCFFCWSARASS